MSGTDDGRAVPPGDVRRAAKDQLNELVLRLLDDAVVFGEDTWLAIGRTVAGRPELDASLVHLLDERREPFSDMRFRTAVENTHTASLSQPLDAIESAECRVAVVKVNATERSVRRRALLAVGPARTPRSR